MRRPWLRLALASGVVGVVWMLAYGSRHDGAQPARQPAAAASRTKARPGAQLEPVAPHVPLGLSPVESRAASPADDSRSDPEVQPAVYQVTPVPADRPPAVVPAPATRYDHAPDHAWLVGELQYVHVRNAWRLRYAAVDELDRHGGSVTLNGLGGLAQTLRTGQWVRVEGRLADPSSREPSPAYRVQRLRVLGGK